MRPWLFLAAIALQAAPTPTRLLLNQDGRHAAFTGVGRLRADAVCTASLVQPNANASGPVYALTNGHCVIDPTSNQVFLNPPVPANSALTFHFFTDTRDRQQPYRLRSIPYATMKGLDIAIVELDTDWPTLQSAGVKPVPLRTAAPQTGESVFTIGAPINGVPDTESWLRRSDCSVAAAAQLAEGPWQFHDALRLFCGGISGGASGSPVFDAKTGEAVAIINTATQGQVYSSGDFPCFLNSPCELTRPRGELILDAAYALPLTGVAACFNAEGQFQLDAPACPLDPGVELTVRTPPFASVRPGTAWNVTLSHTAFTHYRYKTGSEISTNCRVDSGYSDLLPLTSDAAIRTPIGDEDGRYVLCLLGEGGGLKQQVRHATYVHAGIDTQPPVLSPQWLVRADGGSYSVQLIFLVPDLSDYRYKFGPDLATNCDDPAGYQIYRRIPIRVPASKSELIRFCVMAGDRTDNFTRATQILLGENQPLPAGAVNSAGFAKGPLSPGAYASIFFSSAVETETAFRFKDAAGTERTLPAAISGQQANVMIPFDAAPGPAQLRVPGPFPSNMLLDIQPVAPGIFVNPDRRARGFYRHNGSLLAIAGCSDSSNCSALALPVPVELRLQCNGLRALHGQEIIVRIAGQSLRGAVNFDNVTVTIPSEFPYRGLVPVGLDYQGVKSNIAYLHLKDEGI